MEDGCGMDCGAYYWVNHYERSDYLDRYRKMTAPEISEFKKELYCFARPSKFYPNGKKS